MTITASSNAQNMTGKVIATLSSPEFAPLILDVVIGATSLHRLVIEEQVKDRLQTTLYSARPHLADLIDQANLAFSAGGTTSWERCCLGLPTFLP